MAGINKMGFPKYKHSWVLGKKMEDGWEDRGRMGYWDPDTRVWVGGNFHAYCWQVLHIGREAGDVFMFCPRCLIKIEDKH